MESYIENKLKQLSREADKYKQKYYKLCDWLEQNYPKVFDRYDDYQSVGIGDEEDGNY